MEQKGPEVQLQVEGAGLLRISLVDGEVIGLEDILEKVADIDAMRVVQMVNITGEGLEKAGNYAGAARTYLAAYEIALKAGDRLNTAAIVINLGLALKRADQLDTALATYTDALTFLQQPEESPEAEGRRTGLLASVLLNTALLHIAKSAPLEASRAANWCLDLVRYNDDDASRTVATQCEMILKDVERMRRPGPSPATLVIRESTNDT